MEYLDETLEGEAPCEFCGELFPLVLLIEHQSIHLINEEDYGYLDEILNQEEVQNVISESIAPEIIVEKSQQSDVVKEPQVIVEQKQQSAVSNQTNTSEKNTGSVKNLASETEKSTENITTEQKQNEIFRKTLKDIKKFPEQKKNESVTEKGEKLLVLGDEIDPDKELENEKAAYKMPNNQLLNSIYKNEDVIDINDLSDDDCDESLEEFWKRARDFLKRNRVKK